MISFLPIYSLTETKMTKHRKVQHCTQWESNMLFKLVALHKFFVRSCYYKPERLLGSTERLCNSYRSRPICNCNGRFLRIVFLFVILIFALHRRSQGGSRGPGPPNRNVTNDKNVTKKTTVSSVSVSFSTFASNNTRVQP